MCKYYRDGYCVYYWTICFKCKKFEGSANQTPNAQISTTAI